MREIKFRGLMTNGLDWDYGFYFSDDKGHYIVDFEGIESSIMPETVGQYIGLKDKNGKEIFDGDIFPIPVGIQQYANFMVGEETTINGYVEWNKYQLCWQIGFKPNKHNIISSSFGWFSSPKSEVIGNIHQNPELIASLNN